MLDGAVARDRFGNARGGIRLPELDLPVATYSPNNEVDVDDIPGILQPAIPLLNLFCVLSGSVFPFDEATLASLYPSAETVQGALPAPASSVCSGTASCSARTRRSSTRRWSRRGRRSSVRACRARVGSGSPLVAGLRASSPRWPLLDTPLSHWGEHGAQPALAAGLTL